MSSYLWSVLAAALGCASSVSAAEKQTSLPPIYRKAIELYQKKGHALGRKYELKESSEVPEWARSEPAPLWRFVHITDPHYTPRLEIRLRQALQFVSREVRPKFVAFTGDIAPSARQRTFRQILDDELRVPWYMVRGDNWPQGFTQAFGDVNWSFTCGGVGLVGASIDRDMVGHGIGIFDQGTHQWVQSQLEAHRGRPVVFFMHENFLPPTFLDAPKLRQDFESRGNVVATVTGHLHYDYELRHQGILHIIGPAFGPHEEHPFKVFEIHPDHITVRTVKWRDNRFQYVCLHQRIGFPTGLTHDPPSSSAAIGNYTALPHKELVPDPALAGRVLELLPHLMAFVQLTGRSEEIWADVNELMVELNKALMQQE